MNSDHMAVANMLYHLGEVYREEFDIIEAERLHRMSFEMRFRIEGSLAGNSQKVRPLYKLAFEAAEHGVYLTAKRIFAECISFLRRLHID